MSNADNNELDTEGKNSQRKIVSQDGKFDYKRSLERGRSPDPEIHKEINNDPDSNRGGDSDYVYSPSSDGKQQEQNKNKPNQN